MTEPARTKPSPTAADAIEDEVQEALAICGATLANAFLEAEISQSANFDHRRRPKALVPAHTWRH